MNQEEANQKILEIMNKYYNLSQEEIQLFKELISKCDLKIQEKYGHTPLMYALFYNKSENLNINEDQWDYLIKNSDLRQQNKYGDTPIMYALYYNKSENLNLNKEQLDYLIKNSKLKQQNKVGWTPLMYALKYNKDQKLNINEEQWDYIIQNSDLKQKNKINWIPLMYALYYNKSQNLNLTKTQFKEMYAALNEIQQQKTFEKLIQKNQKNNQQYLKEINLLLYDCEFKQNEKTINWLTKNNHQDIIQMIEKRDVFFQLNKAVKVIDKKEKIAIKI